MSFQFTSGSNTITLNGSPTANRTVTFPNKSGTIALTSQMPNVPASVSGYVTSTWRSGNNWYRRWSDGFVEQGGDLSSTSGSKTFHTNFSNTNSIFVMVQPKSGGHANDFQVIASASNTTSFSYNAPRYPTSTWYACGY